MPATPSSRKTDNVAHQPTTDGKRQWLWLAALVLSLVLIATDSWLRIRRINAVTHAPGFAMRNLVEDTASPTGFQGGVHELALPSGAADSQHWIMQTEQMFASGELRIRHVNYDNAPTGREIHWASPYRWWIGLVARFLQATTEKPLPRCIENAALYSNPLLLALALLATTPWIARRFGPLSAAVYCLGMAGMLPTFDCFNAGAPDHHGLAVLCGIFTLLFLVAGLNGAALDDAPQPTSASPRQATGIKLAWQTNRYLIVSGVAGGLGLWNSAASQILVLAGIGLGACVALLARRFSPDNALVATRHNAWLIWSSAGALTSLLGYAIEYLPAGLSLRLEVNHPLYALAWFGAGQLLTSASQWADGSKKSRTRNDLMLNGAALFAALLPALLILFLGSSCFRVSDPFLWALHKTYIDEFQGIGHLFKRGFHLVILCGLLPLSLLLLPFVFSGKEKVSALLNKTFVLAFFPGVILTLFALRQIRWMGLTFALLLVGLLIVTSRNWFDRPGRIARRFVLIFVAMVAIGQPLRIGWAANEGIKIGELEQMHLRVRDLSHWLRYRAGSDDVIVASSPTMTTPLIYFGGLRGIGTFYWENLEGLKTCSDLFSATSFDEAERIVREQHITHIVLASWDSFVREYVSLNERNSTDRATQENAFAARLVKSRAMPPWLRLVPYTLPNLPPSATDEVLIFEVVPAQTQEQRLTRLAHYFVDMGLPQTALQLLPALERDPNNLNAVIARARIHLALQNRAGFEATLAALPAAIPQEGQLDLEETLHFSAIHLIAGHNEFARQQVVACLDRIDAKTVRKLSPNAAYALLALGRQFELPLTVEIANLAAKLIAPELREQIFGRTGQAQP
jgi:hypothetical protein